MSTKKKESESFESHFRKLEEFSKRLQEGEVSVDELVPQMQDALESLKVCKSVLGKTKSQLQEVTSAFEEMEQVEEAE